MSQTSPRPLRWLSRLAVAAALGVAALTAGWWWPRLQIQIDTLVEARQGRTAHEDPHAAAGHDAHDEHDAHGAHDAHDDHHHADPAQLNVLELSSQAIQNLGLTAEYLQPLSRQTFRRSITLPAVVIERPGRTRINVAVPMTGVVTDVYAVTGEAVEPGDGLLQVRLTHEDLVRAQVDFLRTLGELDVELKEVARLQEVTRSGAVAGRILLEREYAQERLQAQLNAEREALRLHGLSERQVDQMAADRKLLSELRIVAPAIDGGILRPRELELSGQPVQPVSFVARDAAESASPRPLVVSQLHVQRGESVPAGKSLCELADYSVLFVQGQAFERDSAVIDQATERRWPITAVWATGSGESRHEELPLRYIDNEIDPVSRTLHIYVSLQNEVIRDERNEQGQRFVTWRYRPGQRLELLIPVEEWTGQFVVPVTALAADGAESYVFRKDDDHFVQTPVHVLYRDQHSAVLADDGSVFAGQVIALRNAHQMQMALKNKAGGGIDPHAGHSH